MPIWSPDSFDEAVHQAEISLSQGGVPVGAALDNHGKLISWGHNERVQLGDPIAHGEMSCIRLAGRLHDYHGTVLYTTLAPCAMCAGTIVQFQIPTVVVGENRTFAGELDFLREKGIEVILLDDQRCVALMQEFQERFPEVWKEDIGQNAST